MKDASAGSGELDRLFDSVVGAVGLRVSDQPAQTEFYARAIGLSPGDAAGVAELRSADGDILLRLDTSKTAGSTPAPQPYTGLFHVAYRYPDRAALGAAVRRTAKLAPLYEGASDHGVSEAVYFRDPEGNGIELYRDRPFNEWPAGDPGKVGMYTQPLDLAALVAEATESEGAVQVDVGHIHLQTAAVAPTLEFWRDLVGLAERQRFGPQAVFLAEGLYHHHVGANTWHSAGAKPIPGERPGLESFELRLRTAGAVDEAAARLERGGATVVVADGRVQVTDPDGNRVVLRSRQPSGTP